MNELPVVHHNDKAYYFDERLCELRERKTAQRVPLTQTDSDVLAFWLKKKNASMVDIAIKDIFGDEHE